MSNSKSTRTDNFVQSNFASLESHSFNIGIAYQFGVIEAVLYNHILFWLRINKVKKVNFIQDKTWTYCTYSEMHAYLPYLSEQQIRRAMKKLVDNGVIIKGNFNKNPFDHTMWYSVENEGSLEMPISKNLFDASNSTDREVEFDTSDPSNSTDLYIRNKDNINIENIRECADKVDASTSSISSKPFIERAPQVKTTNEEHEKLVAKYGLPLTEECYKELSEWKDSATPSQVKKHKSDYQRILKWVASSLRERQVKEAKLAVEEQKIKQSGGSSANISPEELDRRRGLSKSYVKNHNSLLTEKKISMYADHEDLNIRYQGHTTRIRYADEGFYKAVGKKLKELDLPLSSQ